MDKEKVGSPIFTFQRLRLERWWKRVGEVFGRRRDLKERRAQSFVLQKRLWSIRLPNRELLPRLLIRTEPEALLTRRLTVDLKRESLKLRMKLMTPQQTKPKREALWWMRHMSSPKRKKRDLLQLAQFSTSSTNAPLATEMTSF